jgi:hypothetical protein
MKKFLFYTAGSTTIFAAGVLTGAVIIGRMVTPIIDEKKFVDKVVASVEKTRTAIEVKIFGEPIQPSRPSFNNVADRPRYGV